MNQLGFFRNSSYINEEYLTFTIVENFSHKAQLKIGYIHSFGDLLSLWSVTNWYDEQEFNLTFRSRFSVEWETYETDVLYLLLISNHIYFPVTSSYVSVCQSSGPLISYRLVTLYHCVTPVDLDFTLFSAIRISLIKTLYNLLKFMFKYNKNNNNSINNKFIRFLMNS